MMWKGCRWSKIGWVLLIVGALNWGLIGLGGIFNANWNVVYLILGSGILADIVYILVGISGVVFLFGCKCGKCKTMCGSCGAPKNGGMEGPGMRM